MDRTLAQELQESYINEDSGILSLDPNFTSDDDMSNYPWEDSGIIPEDDDDDDDANQSTLPDLPSADEEDNAQYISDNEEENPSQPHSDLSDTEVQDTEQVDNEEESAPEAQSNQPDIITLPAMSIVPLSLDFMDSLGRLYDEKKTDLYDSFSKTKLFDGEGKPVTTDSLLKQEKEEKTLNLTNQQNINTKNAVYMDVLQVDDKKSQTTFDDDNEETTLKKITDFDRSKKSEQKEDPYEVPLRKRMKLTENNEDDIEFLKETKQSDENGEKLVRLYKVKKGNKAINLEQHIPVKQEVPELKASRKRINTTDQGKEELKSNPKKTIRYILGVNKNGEKTLTQVNNPNEKIGGKENNNPKVKIEDPKTSSVSQEKYDQLVKVNEELIKQLTKKTELMRERTFLREDRWNAMKEKREAAKNPKKEYQFHNYMPMKITIKNKKCPSTDQKSQTTFDDDKEETILKKITSPAKPQITVKSEDETTIGKNLTIPKYEDCSDEQKTKILQNELKELQQKKMQLDKEFLRIDDIKEETKKEPLKEEVAYNDELQPDALEDYEEENQDQSDVNEDYLEDYQDTSVGKSKNVHMIHVITKQTGYVSL